MRGSLQGLSHLPYQKDAYWEYCCKVLGYECITKKQIYEQVGYKPLAKLEEVHKDRSLNRVIQAANRCLTADMRVQTKRGFIPANEVVVGDIVACKSNNKFCNREDLVINSFKSKEKVPIIEIKTKRGYVIKGNYTHPLWTRKEFKSKPEWVELQDLQLNNWVALEKTTDVWPEQCEVTVEEAYFLGVMTGDGCFTKHDGVMSCAFNIKDEESAQRLERYLDSCNINHKRYIPKGRKNQFNIDWCSIKFKKSWASRVELERTANKKVPEIVMRGTKEVVKAFLRGLFDADGCADKIGGIIFVNTSKVLAEQVHQLLLKFGVYSTIKALPPELKWRRPSTTYRVSAGGTSAGTYATEIGFENARKQARLKPNRQKTRIYWDRIVSIKEVGEEYVYGLTTLKTNTYVSNGFISHNCGKTYFAAHEALPYLLFMGANGWYVSASYALADEFYKKLEEILIGKLGMVKTLRNEGLEFWEFTFSPKTYVLNMGTGSTLQLKSAESPNSMHSVPLDYVIIDEASLIPFVIYDTRLVPRLADNGGWVLSIGTPENYDSTGEWFDSYYDLGQMPNDYNIKSWTLKLEDNKFEYAAVGGESSQQVASLYNSNWAKIERENPNISWPLKSGEVITVYNFDKLWLDEQKKRIAPEVYAARFEAKRGVSPYTVFPSWSDKVYVDYEEKYTKYDSDLPVYIGIDTGGTYAVVAVQFKLREDNTNTLTKGYDMCIIDELYYQHTVTSAEVYNTCSAREWWPGLNRKVHSWWPAMQGAIDATSNEQQLVWQHEGRKDKVIQGLNLSSRKGDVNAGIETLQHFLDTHSIWVNPKCMYWRMEMRKYQHRAPSYSQVGILDPRKQDSPVDAWNHLIKACIYLIVCKWGYFGKTGSGTMVSRDKINELWAMQALESEAKNNRRKGAFLSKYA